jgi:hypothetical protein
MPVRAIRLLRKTRGGSQPRLVLADDGHQYVVKARNNPQGRRILINELACTLLLKQLRIPAAVGVVIEYTAEFLAEYPDMAMERGRQALPVEAGWHYGSRHPPLLENSPVYDLVPDIMLDLVLNPQHFWGVLVFDRWVGNADNRQSIFLRNPPPGLIPEADAETSPRTLAAMMIDHGYCFNGPHWDYMDAARLGAYHSPMVYRGVRGLKSFEPWLEQIRNFPTEAFDEVKRSIPARWFDGDEDLFDQLLEKLWNRRRRIDHLVESVRSRDWNPFPDWPN